MILGVSHVNKILKLWLYYLNKKFFSCETIVGACLLMILLLLFQNYSWVDPMWSKIAKIPFLKNVHGLFCLTIWWTNH